MLSNIVARIENSDDRLTLQSISVFQEMHRIAQRQFEWQRGFLSVARLYRSAFLYCDGNINSYFFAKNGCNVSEFMFICFALRALWQNYPVVNRDTDFTPIGVEPKVLTNAMDIITIPVSRARKRAAILRSQRGHVAYLPSLFRQFPCVAFGERHERLRAPLPDLVSLRSTNGIFYDVVDGKGQIGAELGDKFEQYCEKLLILVFTADKVRRSMTYRLRKNNIDSPDLLISGDNGINLIVECKAKRMSFQAKYDEDPLENVRESYSELVKGVLQVWRFASHCRQQLVPNGNLDRNSVGLILTLDSWLLMSTIMQEKILEEARDRCCKVMDICSEDQIKMAFCSIEDLEAVYESCTSNSLISALREISGEKYRGWLLSSVHENISVENTKKPYPFEQEARRALPWLEKIKA